nr:hypothetical protein [Parerythrobacter lutipelagi]
MQRHKAKSVTFILVQQAVRADPISASGRTPDEYAVISPHI